MEEKGQGSRREVRTDLLVVLLLGVVTTLSTGSRLCALALDTAGTSTTVGRGEGKVDVLREATSIPAVGWTKARLERTFCESRRTTNEGTLTICLPTLHTSKVRGKPRKVRAKGGARRTHRMCLWRMRTRAWWIDLARPLLKTWV